MHGYMIARPYLIRVEPACTRVKLRSGIVTLGACRRCRFAFQPAGIVDAKFIGPTANGFVGNDDSAVKQHFFDQAQTERKSKI